MQDFFLIRELPRLSHFEPGLFKSILLKKIIRQDMVREFVRDLERKRREREQQRKEEEESGGGDRRDK